MTASAFETNLIRDDVLLVQVGTRLDNRNAPAMLQLINDSQAGGVRYIILDCQELELLTSAGVGSILGSVESVRQNQGDLVLCGLSQQARRVLHVLDLLAYLTVVESRQEAETFCTP